MLNLFELIKVFVWDTLPTMLQILMFLSLVCCTHSHIGECVKEEGRKEKWVLLICLIPTERLSTTR